MQQTTSTLAPSPSRLAPLGTWAAMYTGERPYSTRTSRLPKNFRLGKARKFSFTSSSSISLTYRTGKHQQRFRSTLLGQPLIPRQARLPLLLPVPLQERCSSDCISVSDVATRVAAFVDDRPKQRRSIKAARKPQCKQ